MICMGGNTQVIEIWDVSLWIAASLTHHTAYLPESVTSMETFDLELRPVCALCLLEIFRLHVTKWLVVGSYGLRVWKIYNSIFHAHDSCGNEVSHDLVEAECEGPRERPVTLCLRSGAADNRVLTSLLGSIQAAIVRESRVTFSLRLVLSQKSQTCSYCTEASHEHYRPCEVKFSVSCRPCRLKAQNFGTSSLTQ